MKIANRRRLRDYERAHPDARSGLRAWWKVTKAVQWSNFSEVRQTFGTASAVDVLVVFNVKGTAYRLVTWIDYERKLVVMKWFGSHAEYEKGVWKR
jgi:mRNA interferase HigB